MENKAGSAIEKLQNEFDEFAYIVSHDLKAPLRAITNITHWIEEDFGEDIDEDIQSNFSLLRGRVDRMNRMIDALTQFSRVGRRELDIIEVNVGDLLGSVKEDLELRFPNVSISIKNELGTITTYKNKLYKVLHSVTENAVTHNQDKKDLRVGIEVSKEENTIKFAVIDNGEGIPDYAKNKVFNLFYTVKGKDQAENIGGGLALVKKIVEFVGGKIEFESSPENTTFIIYWPEHK